MSLFERDVLYERWRFKIFHYLDLPERNFCSQLCLPALSPCSLAESGPCKPLEQGGNPAQLYLLHSFFQNVTVIEDLTWGIWGYEKCQPLSMASSSSVLALICPQVQPLDTLFLQQLYGLKCRKLTFLCNIISNKSNFKQI